LKARAGRRRPGYLQHRTSNSKEETQRHDSAHRTTFIMSDSRHNWNEGLVARCAKGGSHSHPGLVHWHPQDKTLGTKEGPGF
jgi:hypothetical protein